MTAVRPVHAAEYVRMSTGHQRYSIEAQQQANLAYAAANGFEIVRTYVDSGLSGLTLRRRPGLQALLEVILGGRAEFTAVLTLDVSRWGRFQDPDEGAHYEFLCRQAGVRIVLHGRALRERRQPRCGDPEAAQARHGR